MNKFCVRVFNPQISRVVQEFALKNGWGWAGHDNRFIVQYTDREVLHFNERGDILYSDYKYALDECKHELISLEDFFSNPRVYAPIRIGEYNVLISKDHIKVGCQLVAFDTVKVIYDRMNDLRKNHG